MADEPTSGLDVTVQAQILDQMWDNCRSAGAAVLIVTQDLGIVANYCDRVLVMKDGSLVEAAETGKFFRAPEHPYSRSVLALQRSASDGSKAMLPVPVGAGPPLLSLAGLTKLYPVRGSKSKVHAVDGISIDINAGECVGLVGESGSGKTTVGRCVLRLVEPTEGSILYHGRDLSSISAKAFQGFRSKLQIVFQDPLFSLNPRMTVGEAIAEGIIMHTDFTKAQIETRIGELMSLVGLSEGQRHQFPRELSAGQQQRAAIARALGCDPEFIVLDEPTSALTPETTAEIVTLLMDLSRRLGLAYLFISHDLTTVGSLCHRVVVMYLGQVVESGTVAQVFKAPRHPYSVSLLASHLFPGTEDRRVDREVRATLKGEIPSPLTESLPKGCYLYGRCPSQEDRCKRDKQVLREMPDGGHGSLLEGGWHDHDGGRSRSSNWVVQIKLRLTQRDIPQPACRGGIGTHPGCRGQPGRRVSTRRPIPATSGDHGYTGRRICRGCGATRGRGDPVQARKTQSAALSLAGPMPAIAWPRKPRRCQFRRGTAMSRRPRIAETFATVWTAIYDHGTTETG